jgi:hypothetical protein
MEKKRGRWSNLLGVIVVLLGCMMPTLRAQTPAFTPSEDSTTIPGLHTKTTEEVGVVFEVQPDGGKPCVPEKQCAWELVVEQGGQSEWSLFTHEKPPLKAGQCVQFVARMTASGERFMTPAEKAAHLPLLISYKVVDKVEDPQGQTVCDLIKENMGSVPTYIGPPKTLALPWMNNPPAKGIEYRGIYLGEPLQAINLKATNCSYDVGEALNSLVLKHLGHTCMLGSTDGHTVTSFIEFETGPENPEHHALRERLGAPYPLECRLASGTPADWTCWKLKDGTWVGTERTSVSGLGNSRTVIYFNETVFLKPQSLSR